VGTLVFLAARCAPPALAAEQAADNADYQPGSQFTFIFDTGSPSAQPLSAKTLDAKTGWILLAEDDTSHRFKGDAVLLNDKLVLVLRVKGAGAEVNYQTPAGPQQRAVLTATAGQIGNLPLSRHVENVPHEAHVGNVLHAALRILENTRGAAQVAATFPTSDGRRLGLQCGLTTGQQIVELRPAEVTEKLVVRSDLERVVVPDFFGDDMVFAAASTDRSRLGLPTENLLLGLAAGGDAMLMCVWQSNKRAAQMVVEGDKSARAIRGLEIEAAKDESLWVAFLEAPRIWHHRRISAQDAGKEVALEWKPPFTARWRADFVRASGMAQSWVFGDAGEPDCPCRLADGRVAACIAPVEKSTPPEPLPDSILVYPLDRSRATPLTAMCFTDVLRNTLGVGPCQYILQTEGLDADANPTPDTAMTWIEQQFKKKKDQQAAAEIRQRLKQMVGHVEQVEGRIGQYAALAARLQPLCKTPAEEGDAAETVKTLRSAVAELGRRAAAEQTASGAVQQAAGLAKQVVALVGKEDATGECERLGAELRQVGAKQDRTLSRCRMAARWLREQARTVAAGPPRDAAVPQMARQIQSEIDKALEQK
jgi:hypothetical protein